MWQRVTAIVLLIVGLLLAVLGVVSEFDTIIRLTGAGLMLVALIWLYRLPTFNKLNEQSKQPLKWYQSPIVWVPVIGIIIYCVSLAL